MKFRKNNWKRFPEFSNRYFSSLYKPIRSSADMGRPWKCYRRAQIRFEWYQAEFDNLLGWRWWFTPRYFEWTETK